MINYLGLDKNKYITCQSTERQKAAAGDRRVIPLLRFGKNPNVQD